jgi:F0F1-type ATP synthase delta subunit
METRKPKVGDRVAIPGHALVFFIKIVNEAEKTVDAEIVSDAPLIEKNIPWKLLTFLDS